MTAKADKFALAKRFLQLGEQEQSKFIALLEAKGLKFEKLPLVSGEKNVLAPLSPAQQRLWDTYQLDAGNSAYHMGGAFQVNGPLHLPTLENALLQVMAQHEVLRTRFIQTETGDTRQYVESHPAPPIELVDGQHIARDMLHKIADEFVIKPFDLRYHLPIRVQCIQTGIAEYRLLIIMHHIISDGWSVGVFIRDLISAYQGLPLTPLDIQYRDYALWQRALLKAGKDKEHFAFWQQEMGRHPPPKLYPWVTKVMPNQRRTANSISDILPEITHRKLTHIARQLSVTTASLWLGLWQSALAQATGQSDIVVGMPMANRQRPEVADVMGFFVNTVVINQSVTPYTTISTVIKSAHQKVLTAQEHLLLPFDQIVDALPGERAAGETPYFQALFNHQIELAGIHFLAPDIAIIPINQQGQHALFDVVLDIREQATATRVVLTYAEDRICDQQMRRLSQMLSFLVDNLASLLDKPIAQINRLSQEEQQKLEALSQPEGQWQYIPVTQMFSEQARQRPDAIAIKHGSKQYSFAELESRSNQLAHYLRTHHVKPDDAVGVLFERGSEMIIAMIAIMKAGGAFLPLDPDYPTERLAYMLENSGARLILIHEHSRTRWQTVSHYLLSDTLLPDTLPPYPPLQPLNLDTLPLASLPDGALDTPIHADQLAYIIYTSGSTGKPKGVAIAHSGLSMHVQTIGHQYGMTPDDIELHFASISFDGAVERWTVPLAFGSTLIIRDQTLWSAEQTCKVLEQEGVTITCFPPSYMGPLLDWIEQAKPKLQVRSWTLGGEAFTRDVYLRLQALVKPARIINGYGPTETVVTPMIWRAYPQDTFDSTYAPIGQPVGSRRLYVLDHQLNRVALGEIGELYIGDESGLARGYLHQPDLTAARFIPDPFRYNGERMYRTGDRVRWRTDGVMEYLGRMDQQVKIRGFRVELGEIERRLQNVSGVETCIVATHKRGDHTTLVGYLCGANTQNADKQGILDALAGQLPNYMVPTQLIVLDKLPLTPVGKIDRNALPMPDSLISTEIDYQPPQDEQEALLAEIWQMLLGKERISRQDNFFALGGDSILCLQLINKLKQAGFTATPKQVFATPMLCELAAELARIKLAQTRTLPTAPFGLMPIQAHFMAQHFADPNHWNQHLCVALKQEMSVEALDQALNALVEHHPALRLAFSKHGEGWQQRFLPFSKQNLLWHAHVDSEEEFASFAYVVQSSLSLENGRLIQAGYAKFNHQPDVNHQSSLNKQPSRLLVVIHHMAVDGVSWRILLDDLWAAYQQIVAGQKIDLPLNDTSLDQTVRALNDWSESDVCQQKQHYWQTQISQANEQIAYYADKKTFTITLASTLTADLLAANQDIQSQLLAALPVSSLTDKDELPLYLEGHGREFSVYGKLDLSRLVGWMTSLYPFKLAANQQADDIYHQLKQVREDGGISFGIRYLQAAHQPEGAMLTFNYLGQYSANHFAHWCQPLATGGPAQSPENTLLTPLAINVQIVNGALSANWEFADSHYTSSEVASLAKKWLQRLTHQITQMTPALAHADANLLEPLNSKISSVPPVFCFHPVTGRLVGYQPLAQALEGQRTLYGLESQSFVYHYQFATSLAQMANIYHATIRQAQPKGPYALIGWSLGGALCQEVAARIEGDGEQIEFLGVLDCYVPGTEISADQWPSPISKARLIYHLKLLLGGLTDQQKNRCLNEFDTSTPDHWPQLFDVWLAEHQFDAYIAENARQVLYSWAVEQHMRALCHNYRLPRITTPIHTYWAGQPSGRYQWLKAELEKVNSLASSKVYDTDHVGIIKHPDVISFLKQSLIFNVL